MKWKLLSHVRLFVTPWTIQSMEFLRLEYWSGWPFPSPVDLFNPGMELRSLALQADSLPAEPQGKPKNTEVGSLSLLQWIFLTQEWNQGLLHCRWILYQLSYQGNPNFTQCYLTFVSWENYMWVKNQQLEPCMKPIGTGLRKEYHWDVCCHPVCLTYTLSTSWEMPGWVSLQAGIKIGGRNINKLR